MSPSKISASSTSESTLIFLLWLILFYYLLNLPCISILMLLEVVFIASFGLVLLFFDLSVRPPKGVRSTLLSLLDLPGPNPIVDVLFILSVLCPGLRSLFLLMVLWRVYVVFCSSPSNIVFLATTGNPYLSVLRNLAPCLIMDSTRVLWLSRPFLFFLNGVIPVG